MDVMYIVEHTQKSDTVYNLSIYPHWRKCPKNWGAHVSSLSYLLCGQRRLRHLPHIQIDPLPPHPTSPIRILWSRPIAQPTGTRLRYDFRYAMPRKPRRTGHVHSISRTKSNNFAPFPVVVADHEQRVAADTDTDKADVALFAYIAVHG